MSCYPDCKSLWGTLNLFFHKLQTPFLKLPGLNRRPTLNNAVELLEALMEAENNPVQFITIIVTPLGPSVYLRLFHLESFIDDNKLLDSASNLPREDVDKQVPYQFQNVRAYFYYLSLKARIREHQQTFKLEEMTNKSKFNFSFETIMFEIRESSRFMTSLVPFLPYCEASVQFDLTESIFTKRITVIHELFCGCYVLFFFVLVHSDQYRQDIPVKETVSALKYFNRATSAYSQMIENIHVSFDFENKVKTHSRVFFTPILSLFETIFYFKNPSNVDLFNHLELTKSYLEKFMALEFTFEIYLKPLLEIANKRIAYLGDKPWGESLVLDSSQNLESLRGSPKTPPTTPKFYNVAQKVTNLKDEIMKTQRSLGLRNPQSGELLTLMSQPSILIKNK